MNVDCVTWDALARGRKQVERMKAFPQMDEIDAKMLETARAVFADQRRYEAVRKDCPARFAEMERLLAERGEPKAMGLDLDTLPSQLAGLSDEDLGRVEALIDAERRSRGDGR